MSDLIEAHIAHLRAAGYSDKTIYSRYRILHRLADDLPQGLDEALPVELARWFAPWKGWTLCTYWEHAYGFYVWATSGRRPHLSYNPMGELRRPRPPHREPNPATDDEITYALQHLPDPWRRGVLIATLNGLRSGEICRLDREQVTAQHLQVHRKGGKVQLLPTHVDVWSDLSSLAYGPIVRTARGEPWEPNDFSHRASEELTRIGLSHLTLHRFRASFATRLSEAGVHISVIQELMGHASVATTQGYIKVKDEQRRLAISTLLVPTGTLVSAA